jgi:TIR domain-containing protein
MSHSVFISYSRRELPFVDVLLGALEDEGVEVWVDYHSLVPARPWLDQILEGIRQAEVFLLVVSKESMASTNVRSEYQYALEQKKRIILIIFEAVSLPPALQNCEWIDFHTSFSKKKMELLAQLDTPIQQSVPPQKGFTAPFIAWLSFFMSLLTILVSIPGWWTFFIPALLIPLPFQILRRNFPFYRIRFALLALPLVLFLSWIFFLTYPILYTLFSIDFLVSLLVSPLLLLLLSSKGMRLWGKPTASAPRFANPYQPNVEHPTPVAFFIKHAPEDKKYAETISSELKKYGHPYVTDIAKAEANFVLISRFKSSTAIDPEKHVLYPILIQDTNIGDGNIQRIQWIDFRRGIRNLDRLAKLLPEPAKLLKAMGIAPISGQILYPRIIEILDYFLALLAFFALSAWIPLGAELGRELFQLDNWISFLIVNAIFSALTLVIIFLARRALIRREGRLASLRWLIASLFFIGLIVFIQAFYLLANIAAATALAIPIPASDDLRGSVSMFMPCSCTLGVLLIGLISLWNWQDLIRWFPSR